MPILDIQEELKGIQNMSKKAIEQYQKEVLNEEYENDMDTSS